MKNTKKCRLRRNFFGFWFVKGEGCPPFPLSFFRQLYRKILFVEAPGGTPLTDFFPDWGFWTLPLSQTLSYQNRWRIGDGSKEKLFVRTWENSLERLSYSQTTLPLWSVTFPKYFFDLPPIRHLILIGNVNLTYNIHLRRTLPAQFSTNLWRKETGTGFDIKNIFVLPVKLMRHGAGCLVAFLASASLFLSSSDGQALTKFNYKMF